MKSVSMPLNKTNNISIAACTRTSGMHLLSLNCENLSSWGEPPGELSSTQVQWRVWVPRLDIIRIRQPRAPNNKFIIPLSHCKYL